MKKITFLITVLSFFIFPSAFGQNLVVNGDFESPGTGADPVPSPWAGYKNRIVNDNLTSSFSGQIENGDGSLFQTLAVTAGQTYNVTFDYRWVTSASANSNLVVRVKDANNLSNNLNLIGGTTSNGYALNTTVDTWFNGSFSILIPSGITSVRFLFFKGNGNQPLNIDNVSFIDEALSVNTFEQYKFSTYPNPAKNEINLSASKSIEKIEIFNLLGQQVLKQQIDNVSVKIDISQLKKGVYIIKSYINNSIGSYKFIKE